MIEIKRFGFRVTRYAVLAAMLAVLTGLAFFGTHQVAIESAQAQALVAKGQLDLREGRRAEAVASFERAQLLAPRADFVRSALGDANAQPLETGAARVAAYLAPHEWSALLTAFGWAAGLSLALAIALGKRGRIARRVALAAGLLFALSSAGAVQSAVSARALRVVQSGTGLLMAPYQGAGAIADLQPGVVVAAGSRYGEFIQVRGPNGTHGWVMERALESVVGA